MTPTAAVPAGCLRVAPCPGLAPVISPNGSLDERSLIPVGWIHADADADSRPGGRPLPPVVETVARASSSLVGDACRPFPSISGSPSVPHRRTSHNGVRFAQCHEFHEGYHGKVYRDVAGFVAIYWSLIGLFRPGPGRAARRGGPGGGQRQPESRSNSRERLAGRSAG